MFGRWESEESVDKFFGFNSSIGIQCVRTLNLDVSPHGDIGFNSSIGIQCVRTMFNFRKARSSIKFQFLNRNSVCSDVARQVASSFRDYAVSIPQSEFSVFGPA